ncbi:MAG TPA: four helix bundle protein [Gemmatimonadaceae bacterium]|nr:four helix bundle protein [Gemmatimonadaceae bacterium]
MQNFSNLRAWHLAREIVRDIADLLPASRCRRVPGFHGQILRAARSIAANISEGCGKRSRAELRRYLESAHGSLFEVQSDVEIAITCRMLRRNEHAMLYRKLVVLRRMLASLLRRVDMEGDP